MEGYSTPVWVRLPSLPLCCWDKVNIARITSPLGQPLWIDAATNLLERGVFARACVKVDLSKPLKAGVWVHNSQGSFYQHVEYEGLPVFCFRCGLVGHKATDCKSPKTSRGPKGVDDISVDKVCRSRKEQMVDDLFQADERSRTPPVRRSSSPRRPLSPSSHINPVTATMNVAEQLDDSGLGPWMIVQRRRPSRGPKSFGNINGPSPLNYRPAKKMVWAPVDTRAAAQSSDSKGLLGVHPLPNLHAELQAVSSLHADIQHAELLPPDSCGRNSILAAASSQVVKTRPQSAVPNQSRSPPSTSQADSLPLQAPLSPSPPSIQPSLLARDVPPNAECAVLGSEAQPLMSVSSGMAVDHSMMSLHVQDHACLSAQQDNGEQLVFGGFKALPVCSTGLHKPHGTTKLGARQRRGARLGDKAAVAPLPLPSSSVHGLLDASPSEGAIVPYNNHDAIARMELECGKRKGVLSLKMDRMLNDLGPISLSPRKRRMIMLPYDGGDASPLPTS